MVYTTKAQAEYARKNIEKRDRSMKGKLKVRVVKAYEIVRK